jgi:hypothetical protein
LRGADEAPKLTSQSVNEPTPVPTSDFREYTTWDELCVLQSTLASQWQAYVTWYTWFFGINLLALSWIFSNQTRAGWGIFSLSALMVFCNFIGIGAAVTMRAYHHLIWKRATLLARENPNVDSAYCWATFWQISRQPELPQPCSEQLLLGCS